MPYFQENDVKLYYETDGEGTPIVLLHPPVMGHLTFRFQRPLAKHFKLIFVDLLDSGRSTKHSSAANVTELARLTHSLLKKLNVKKVIVLGYSNGGSIAQEFALRYPESTAGMILIGGFPEVSSFLLKKEFELGIWAAGKELISLFSFVLSRAHFTSHKEQQEMAGFIKKADGETLKRIYEDGMNYVSTDRLAQIKVPVLLLYGKRDRYMRTYLLPFCRHLADLEIVIVSEVAHQVPTKRPEECNQIIKSWLLRKKLVTM
ncbi:alpha/beta hydrolase [Alkalihalobacillus oceani]|uniref:Alpha/beta hydrolase n=1 Tax=Halalkalibacter oceani TaxID=1653776 RepID=A0A9X2DQD8_9BACI|nr:alpha/beta hydrolase [Halalkalibacter oceani]MCM3714225.1 alpha/beta hydrolase [Halalkalibacter oceani]